MPTPHRRCSPSNAEAFWLHTLSDAARIANVRAHPWLALSIIEGEHDTHAAVLTEGPAEVLATVPEDVRSTTELRNRGGSLGLGNGLAADGAAAATQLCRTRLAGRGPVARECVDRRRFIDDVTRLVGASGARPSR